MKRSIRALGVVVILGLVFSLGYLVGTGDPAVLVRAQGGQPADTEELFRPFWEAWNIIQQRYVDIDKVDNNKLMEAALSGMVNALGDENSAYMDPQFFATLTSDMQGEYEGIGATVRKDEATGGVFIVSTAQGSPAREALRQGDIIVTIEGEDITTLPLMQSVSKIRGPAGTSVQLGILREGSREIIEVTVRRARIRRETVTWALYEGNIGYLGISGFTDNATADVVRALRELDANNLNGLVLDMRNDPGGGLQTAINVASQFLQDGPIVVQRGRPGTQDIVYDSTGRTLAPDVPLVIILNEASASASELVAGALQDRGRALVVGTASFGKGSIQQWGSLSNGGGLRITIAEFLKPSGGAINKIGIIPDVYVPWTEEQQRARPNYDPQLTEAIWLLRKKM